VFIFISILLLILDNISYLNPIVQPVPAPPANKPVTNNIKEGGNNQKLILFNLGKAINFVIEKLFKFFFKVLPLCSDYVILSEYGPVGNSLRDWALVDRLLLAIFTI
jgi:hypothetical protein